VRQIKSYGFNEITGCVVQRHTRLPKTATKVLVGLYHSAQSGFENDPELPWTTICEEHITLVCHPTLKLARSWLAHPADWCALCGAITEPCPGCGWTGRETYGEGLRCNRCGLQFDQNADQIEGTPS